MRREESGDGSADCERPNCSKVCDRITVSYLVKQACAEITGVQSSGDVVWRQMCLCRFGESPSSEG